MLYPEDYCNDIFFYSLVNPQEQRIRGKLSNDPWEDQVKVHYELDYSSDVFKLVEGNIIHPDDKSLFKYCKYNSFVIVYDRYRKV